MGILGQTVLMLAIGGALGGLVSGLVKESDLEFTFPGGKKVPIGFIGDAIVGIAASLSVFFVLGPLLNINIECNSSTSDYLRILSISVIAGYSGRGLLTRLSEDLLGKVSKIEKDIENIKDLEIYKKHFQEGEELAESHKHEEAIRSFELALKYKPFYSETICRIAMSLKKLGRVQEAFDRMKSLLEEDSNNSVAWYNKACYGLLLNHDIELVFSDLSKAISGIESLKHSARTDPDFESIHDIEEFKKITE